MSNAYDKYEIGVLNIFSVNVIKWQSHFFPTGVDFTKLFASKMLPEHGVWRKNCRSISPITW